MLDDYIGGLGVYTEDVNANNNNPYGQGEYICRRTVLAKD